MVLFRIPVQVKIVMMLIETITVTIRTVIFLLSENRMIVNPLLMFFFDHYGTNGEKMIESSMFDFMISM